MEFFKPRSLLPVSIIGEVSCDVVTNTIHGEFLLRASLDAHTDKSCEEYASTSLLLYHPCSCALQSLRLQLLVLKWWPLQEAQRQRSCIAAHGYS